MAFVLAVKPNGPWLITKNGSWLVTSTQQGALPLSFNTAVGLLPLLERPRETVEAEVEALRTEDTPDFAQVVRVVVEMELTALAPYWVPLAVDWIRVEEVPVFEGLLVALQQYRHISQRTRHQAKRLLKASRDAMASTDPRPRTPPPA
ncbi:hypothetical protein DQ384_08300 [Sphaerisporangium album]|uniref:Uncharacterized protein n=1 Tax=Sphaerisporangium album TaxID=509200 RepID=A0A367FPL9_9ACTN|nr:hypothetical protein [Sphaerisporangium album]RCG31565.1 hypothetical protein DQ384_08300 [Sphaerisporangium album]